MQRVSALLLALGLAGCSGPPAGVSPPAGSSSGPAPPVLGQHFAALLDALGAPPAEGTRMAISELRVLRVSVEPWETISREEARAEAGPLGVIAHRTCTLRRGLRRVKQARASWYVFEAGRLVSFDHAQFGAACDPTRHFRPSPPPWVEIERTLVRWVAQRYPASRLDSAQQLQLGLALVEVGRLADAEAILRGADRAIDDLVRQRQNVFRDEERAALEEREAELRALRGTLRRALRDAEEHPPPGPQRSGR